MTTDADVGKFRVLLLEDNVIDAELIIRELRRYGFDCDCTRVQTEAAFLAALDTLPDVILADFSLPGFDGMNALESVRNRELNIPFILISGVLRDEFIVTAIKNGAADFILKEHLSRLGPAVTSALTNRRLRDQYLLAEAEKRSANEESRQLAMKQAAILNALPAHIALVDSRGVIVVVNESWKQFAIANGLKSPEFALGANYLDVCEHAVGNYSEKAQSVAKGIRQVLCGESSEYSIEYPCHSPSEKRWFRLTASPMSSDTDSGAVIMHVNITERKLAEDAVRLSEQEQRQLVEQLNSERRRLLDAQAVAKVGSWETDLRNLKVNWSEETFRIFETTPQSFEPTHPGFLRFVHPDDRTAVDAAFFDSFSKPGIHSIEHRLLLAGNAVKFIEERWQAFCDEEGKPVRAIGTCRDITENKSLQHQLVQSQKMEAIGKLAGGVAHDFNNLLTVILSYTDILMRETPSTDPLWSMLNDIEDCAKRAASLTRQLLAFSRQQVLNPQVVDLNAVLADLEKMLRRLIGEDIVLQCQLQPTSARIRIDPGQLEQVIINLVVNARDAMPMGGRLDIETAEIEIDQTDGIALSVSPGPYLSISVADNGTGMTDEVKAQVFEPFFTTKGPGKGTGLGLATVYGIVRQSDGFINLESQAGVGTRFQILLPAVYGHKTISVEADKSVVTGSETILLVEDEAILRRAAKFILESQGYKVLLATNGQEAIDIVQSTTGNLSLVITDVIMPVMSGRVLVEHLRRDYPQLKILFVSGYTDDEVVKYGVFASEDAFLQKPFTPPMLSQKVREVLDS